MTKPLLNRRRSLESDSLPLRPCRRDSDSVSGSVTSSGLYYYDCGSGHPQHVGPANSDCHDRDETQVAVPLVSVTRCLDDTIPNNSVRSEDSRPVRPGRKLSFSEIGEHVLDRVMDELGGLEFYDDMDESNLACMVQGEEIKEIPQEPTTPIETAVVDLVS